MVWRIYTVDVLFNVFQRSVVSDLVISDFVMMELSMMYHTHGSFQIRWHRWDRYLVNGSIVGYQEDIVFLFTLLTNSHIVQMG